MLDALAGFGVLFGLVFLFERKEHDLSASDIAGAVVVPILVALLVRFFAALIGFGIWGAFLSLAVLVITTYLFLRKLLDIRPRRSATYAAVTCLAYFFVGLVFAWLQGQ